MPDQGHVQRLLPLIGEFARQGHEVCVFSGVRFRADIEAAGAQFSDIFEGNPLDAVDATSIPMPSRYVTFAAVAADVVTDRIAARRPGLIVYDTFAVIAPLVARRLNVKYVAFCSGHAGVPARSLAALSVDPRVATSDACHAAVRTLREVHDVPRASPFSYEDNLSPFLNIYGEPPQFLLPEDRAVLEPVAFFGSLAPEFRWSRATGSAFPPRARALNVYVSFGTIIWRYYRPAALAALSVIANECAGRDAQVVLGLGGHAIPSEDRAALGRQNVVVHDYVDQWSTLAEADLFVTHHGLNSTHESIYHRVPMLSYPFFADQPPLARRCQTFGVALPLAEAPQAPIDPAALRATWQTFLERRESMLARLDEVREWELATIRDRSSVTERIGALAIP